MNLNDIKGLQDLLKLGDTLEQITNSLKENLSEEDKKKFDEELEKNGYQKAVKDAKNLKFDVSETLKNYSK